MEKGTDKREVTDSGGLNVTENAESVVPWNLTITVPGEVKSQQ